MPRPRAQQLTLVATAGLLMMPVLLQAAPRLRIEPAAPEMTRPEVDRTLLASIVERPPVIDGRLDDKCWEEASVSSGFVNCATGAPAEVATYLRVGRLGETLYLAAECFEPEMDRLRPCRWLPPARDLPVWEDDCVEFLFDTEHAERGFQAVVVNAAGAVADFDTDDRGTLQWESGARAVVARERDRWTAEIALPLSNLKDPANAIWGFNVVRVRYAEGTTVHVWNRWTPDAARADTFGHLAFAGAPCYIKAAALGAICEGRNQVRVAIVNAIPKELTLTAVLGLARAGLQPKRTNFRLTLPPSAGNWYGFDFDLTGREPVDLLFVLYAPSEEKPLTAFARRGLQVSPPLSLHLIRRPRRAGEQLEAEVQLYTGPEVWKEVRLVATLRAVGGGTTLARAEVRSLSAGRARVLLDTDALEPGQYELGVAIERGGLSAAAREIFQLAP